MNADPITQMYWTADPRFGDDDVRTGTMDELKALIRRRRAELLGPLGPELDGQLFRLARDTYRYDALHDFNTEGEHGLDQAIDRVLPDGWADEEPDGDGLTNYECLIWPHLQAGYKAAETLPWILRPQDGTDLDSLWDATPAVRSPEYLRRTDGAAMFYRGLTHSVHAPSESGKSWLVQYATVERLLAGESVLYLDFERDAAEVLGRLRALGMRRQHLPLLDYVRPTGNVAEHLDRYTVRRYALAVIDGVTESYDLMGLNPRDEGHVARWNRLLPEPLANRTGAAVVQVDHSAKGDGLCRFPVGSQHKLAILTGAAYVPEVASVLSQGRRGELRIYVAKDTPGGVRAHAGPENAEQLQPFARFMFDATDPEGAVVVAVKPWIGGPAKAASVTAMRRGQEGTPA